MNSSLAEIDIILAFDFLLCIKGKNRQQFLLLRFANNPSVVFNSAPKPVDVFVVILIAPRRTPK